MATLTSCHSSGHGHRIEGAPVIALVGAPNGGKSTLFNGLTGAKAHMGNWPGTTVEVSRGAWRVGETTYDVIDFPGAYSLDPASPDEELTRNLVIDTDERPDAVIIAVDAASLSRGLYMVSQLAEHDFRLLVVITKSDVAESQGVTIDTQALSAALGVPVVEVDPRRRSNIAAVGDAIEQIMKTEPQRRRIAQHTDEFELADERFGWIEHAVAKATTRGASSRSFTERIDAVALHPVLGPLLFLAAMWVVFQITTTVAAPFQDGLDALFAGPVSDAVRGWLEPFPPLVTGLIVDGLIGGVGMVLTFAPLMALMFLCLAFLEDSGYMSRAAVVTDRLMKAIGLPGKAFIPLIVGFGCNVPAISATRVLAEPRQRLLTALLIPFTSCSARLTVYVMLAATFFPDNAGTVVFAMYVISIALVVLTGFCLRHTLWRRMGTEPLVIDLPVYQIPGARLAFSVMWVRLKGFLQTAGGIIVATVVVVFVLQSTPMTDGYSFGDENLPPKESAYGVMSDTVAPIFAPAGFGSWSIAGTLVTGFVAKEAVISSWAQTYKLEDVTDASPEEQGKSALSNAIREDFNTASGGHGLAAVWAFMVFLLAYTPCVATLAAQRREIGLKWTIYGVILQLVAAWVLAVLVFQVLSLWL
ncbi:ferrous iron transport protein B [Corynebacterium freiburgense]|uniref:ferrous iron transport protein B n=1 Tax=Corynebacterium freiburgense TaxID=556548 RepID=UPI000421146E|nr:ferrous iron transport protein B [Corynebacterium freiburgense]WJZ02898.1 Ferrous iron transport protein B [Corynebacterium freiburgense]